MDGTPFDLLALPNVAIRKTLSLMSPSQVFRMSRTSEQSKDLIKSIKFDVELKPKGNKVYVWYANGKFFKELQIGPAYMKMEEKEWRDSVTEITRLFRTSVYEIKADPIDFDATWEWINQEQRGVQELDLTVKNTEDPEKIIKIILDNSELKQLKTLFFDMKTSGNLKFTHPFIFKNPPQGLWIGDSSWFTVQHLMDSRVERCVLHSVKFTDEEINFILKQWMNNADCLSNLKALIIFRHNLYVDFDVAFNGFQRENQSVQFGYTRLRLTCGKEFHIEVLAESMRKFGLKKKPFVEELAHAVVAPVADNSARFDDSD